MAEVARRLDDKFSRSKRPKKKKLIKKSLKIVNPKDEEDEILVERALMKLSLQELFKLFFLRSRL